MKHKGNVAVRATSSRRRGEEFGSWEFRFVQLDYYKYSDGWNQEVRDLCTVSLQTDTEKGHLLTRAYGLRITDVNADHLEAGMVVLKHFINRNRHNWRGAVSAVRKFPRVVWNSELRTYVPYAHRKDPVAWVDARKRGYELKRAA